MNIFKYFLNKFEEIFGGFMLLIISFSIIAQVIMRYGFNSSLSWPEEISRYTMVMMCFVTIGLCIKHGVSLKIDTLVTLFPSKIRILIANFGNLFMILLLSYLFYGGFQVTKDSFLRNNLSPALGIPLGYFYAVALLGLLIAVFRLIQEVIKDF